MKFQQLIYISFLLPISLFSYGQTFEMGICFNSGNADFYKNVPGVSLGYNLPVKKVYLFTSLQGSFKSNSYSGIAPDLTDGSGYVMKQVEGQMYHIMLRAGIAHKIINSNDAGLSLGIFASFNHFKSNNELHYYYFDMARSEYRDFFSTNKTSKNRFGGGCFLDFELKHIITSNLSLFSRSTFDIIHYDGSLEGNPFFTRRLCNIGFSAGLRYSIVKINHQHCKE